MKNQILKPISVMSLGLLVAVGLTACETPGQTALLGAGVGAALGANRHGGAVRGAAIGAGAGYLAGRVIEGERRRSYEQGLADRDGYYYDDARSYRSGRYYDDGGRVIVRERHYYTAPSYRTVTVY